MKLDGYSITSQLLEARFNLKSAAKARQTVTDLNSQVREEQDPQRKRELLFRLKQAQSNLALMPNKSYDMHTDY